MDDFIVCHCVSKDCSGCPMRQYGTGTFKQIYKKYKTRKEFENANPETQRKQIENLSELQIFNDKKL